MLKIQRNDKCPCRSGKKYKKCCLLNPDKNAEIVRATSIAQTYEELYQIIAKPMDIYRLKVKLIRMGFDEIDTEISRTFVMEGKQTLYNLHINIQRAFDWDNDHMFSFYLSKNLFDRDNEFSANPLGEHIISRYGKPTKSAADYQLRDLELSTGISFWYLFDYGDELVHRVMVQEIREKTSKDTDLPKIINKRGNAPSQYGDVENE